MKAGIDRYLTAMVNDPDRKTMARILRESVHCAVIEREVPYYYFTNLLYKKGRGKYGDYIGFRNMYKIIHQFFYGGRGGRNAELEDKLVFSKVVSGAGIDTPRIVASSDGGVIATEEGDIEIGSTQDLSALLAGLIRKTQAKSLFVKPIDGSGGKGSFRVDQQSLGVLEGDHDFLKRMQRSRFVFQESIVQHEFSNMIYPGSVNTIRVHTYFNRQRDEVVIPSALMRFGSKGSVVDNGSRGGVFVAIDVMDWTLEGAGITYLNKGGQEHEVHPDTGVRFEGLSIPFGKQIEDIAKKSARLFECDFVGWDIALTPEGPIVIEGNDRPHLVMAQIACGGFKSHPVYKEIFAEYIS